MRRKDGPSALRRGPRPQILLLRLGELRDQAETMHRAVADRQEARVRRVRLRGGRAAFWAGAHVQDVWRVERLPLRGQGGGRAQQAVHRGAADAVREHAGLLAGQVRQWQW